MKQSPQSGKILHVSEEVRVIQGCPRPPDRFDRQSSDSVAPNVMARGRGGGGEEEGSRGKSLLLWAGEQRWGGSH